MPCSANIDGASDVGRTQSDEPEDLAASLTHAGFGVLHSSLE
jgi:hypothetical protein